MRMTGHPRPTEGRAAASSLNSIIRTRRRTAPRRDKARGENDMIEERKTNPAADARDMARHFRGRPAPTALTARGTESSNPSSSSGESTANWLSGGPAEKGLRVRHDRGHSCRNCPHPRRREYLADPFPLVWRSETSRCRTGALGSETRQPSALHSERAHWHTAA